MSNPNGRKGAKFELDVRDYLRDQGLPAHRLHKGGVKDEGDLTVAGWTLQLKNTKHIDLAGALKEAAAQAERSGATRYASVHKKRNHPIAQSYVVMPLEMFLRVVASDKGGA